MINFLIFRNVILLRLRIWMSHSLRRCRLWILISFWSLRRSWILIWDGLRLVVSILILLYLLIFITAYFFSLINICKIHLFFQALNASFCFISNSKDCIIIVWIVLLTIFFNLTVSCYFFKTVSNFTNLFFRWKDINAVFNTFIVSF